MDRKERLKAIEAAIRRALEKNQDFINIMSPDTGKFVQFSIFQSKDTIIMDIPLLELSGIEVEDLIIILDAQVSMDPQSKEYISIQKLFSLKQVRKIPRTVEKVFSDVFSLPSDFEIKIEVFPR